MFTHVSLKKLFHNDWIFFIAVFVVTIWNFLSAFTMHFFADDYFFLQISRARNIFDFFHFYSPFRTYSYKPLASETFYFLLHVFDTNVVIGHIIIFLTYFVGLFFLFRIIKHVTKNDLLSKITVFMYAISFIHVFQLYWFATYQEVALFSFLAISFYTFLQKKYTFSMLFFILASLCKETAVLYVPFLFVYLFFQDRGKIKIRNYYPLIVYIALAVVFWSLYKTGLDHVTSLDNYKIQWNIRLLLNNSVWYSLWALGFPNFMSDYFHSLFSLPLPAFWDALKIHDIQLYFNQLLVYLVGFAGALVSFFTLQKKERKHYFFITLFCILSFFIFLGPILFFPHKWMIRLTLPLLFVSFFQAYLLTSLLGRNVMTKTVAMILLLLYISWNIYGTRTHESSSLYTLENDIYLKANTYFTQHKDQIEQKSVLYFQDTAKKRHDIFNNSQKLQLSFHDQSFLDHFFPGHTMTAVYNFQSSTIPPDSYIVDTNIFFH